MSKDIFFFFYKEAIVTVRGLLYQELPDDAPTAVAHVAIRDNVSKKYGIMQLMTTQSPLQQTIDVESGVAELRKNHRGLRSSQT